MVDGEDEIPSEPCPGCGKAPTRVLIKVREGCVFMGYCCGDSLCREAFRYAVEHWPGPFIVAQWLCGMPGEAPGQRMTPRVREVLSARLAARLLG